MTGEEFLRQLNDMLADVTEEERREAVRYYEEYLRDAGPEQEQQVLAELGSPARVAAIIRANVPGSRAEPAQSAPAPEPEPPRIRGLRRIRQRMPEQARPRRHSLPRPGRDAPCCGGLCCW